MSESERVAQKNLSNTVLDLINKNNNIKQIKPESKLNSLFEIQNTLDDTCLIENNSNSDNNSVCNCHKITLFDNNSNILFLLQAKLKDNDEIDLLNKYYVADTDPEDENEDKYENNNSMSIHLEMSQSILINQSTYSSK